MQSIYAGFVEKNIPAIPRPLGSRKERDGPRLSSAVPKNNGTLTPTAPTAIGLWETFTFWVTGVARDYCVKKKENVCANEGLHSDCQWYVFEKIHVLPFCSSQSADSVCSKQTVTNPTHVVDEESKNLKKKRKLRDLL